jgi:hypothetical protein
MKTILRFFFITLFFILLTNCTSEDDSSNINNDNPNNPQPNIEIVESIKIEGNTDLNFEQLTAKTFDDSSAIGGNGILNTGIEDDQNDELPLIITKGEDIMFGYYSKSGENDSVSLDDMLLFYFRINPGFGWLNISNSALLSDIQSQSNYGILKVKISENLNANTSPFEDDEFNTLLMEASNSIYNTYTASSQRSDLFSYKFNYNRTGQVSWENKFPSFATVGLEITDANGVVSGPHLLDSQSVVISPSSAIEWLWDYFTGNPNSTTTSFQLPTDGDYTMTFTNGRNFATGSSWVGTEALEKKVDERNRFDIAVQTIQLVIPIGLKKLPPGCKSQLGNIFENLLLEPVKLAIDQGTFSLTSFVSGLNDDTFEVVKNCVPDANIVYWESFQNALKKLDFLNTAESVSNLGFLIRDYIASDISGTETRYFYDGVSYGQLTNTNVSGDYFITQIAQTEFSGPTGSQHTYNGIITEKVYEYEVERTLVSTITQKTDDVPAGDIPMLLNVVSGDAIINTPSNVINTTNNESINLSFDMTIGNQNSQIEIKPQIPNGNGIGSAITVSAEPEIFNLQGLWLLKNFQMPENTLYWDTRIQFNADGTMVSCEYWAHTSSPPQTGWLPCDNDYELSYNSSTNILYIHNLYWGVGYPFYVNDINDSVFYFDPNDSYRVELHRL